MLGGAGGPVELKRTWRKGFCRGLRTRYLLGSLNETQRMNSMQMLTNALSLCEAQ
jgi:hypothetical protein